MSTPGPDTTVPIGVYRGAAVDIIPVQAYEAFLGMRAGTTVSYVLAFMLDNPTWPQFEQAILAAGTNSGVPGPSATAWAPLLGGRQLMLAVAACCQGTTWADEASSANDTHWAALTQTLVSGGLGSCLLRIGREFTGGWYRWSASTNTASGNYYQTYQAGYAHVVQVMKAAGFTGKFIWNPYLGQGTMGPSTGAENAYPGDSVVDWIGIDVYDGPDGTNYPAGEVIRTPAQQQAVWNRLLTQWDGLEGWRNWAAGRNKPLCYPEYGLRLVERRRRLQGRRGQCRVHPGVRGMVPGHPPSDGRPVGRPGHGRVRPGRRPAAPGGRPGGTAGIPGSVRALTSPRYASRRHCDCNGYAKPWLAWLPLAH